MNEIAIAVEKLVKVYKEKSPTPVRALDGLTLQVRKGEIFGLLGRNGAGKTTLLRILTTLIPPTSGSVRVSGFDVQREGLSVRKSICVVLQENAAELYLSVKDNFATYARFHSIPREEFKIRLDHVIGQFGLQDYLNQKVIDLSGGLKRRLQVAKVFMIDRPIVFLDEATTGMDPINKRATLNAIREQARLGRTIFLTTHILEEAEELCDTIAIIDHGKCIATGDLHAIKSRVSPVYDLAITFESLDVSTLHQLQSLPLLKFSHGKNTVEMSVKGDPLSTLNLVTELAKTNKIIHFEANSASLEDVFLELLDPKGVQS
jgi:ABC-2 type transport system ATP-binding protein